MLLSCLAATNNQLRGWYVDHPLTTPSGWVRLRNTPLLELGLLFINWPRRDGRLRSVFALLADWQFNIKIVRLRVQLKVWRRTLKFCWSRPILPTMLHLKWLKLDNVWPSYCGLRRNCFRPQVVSNASSRWTFHCACIFTLRASCGAV